MSIGVLFVCAGNICRSPLAEGIFRHYVEQEGLLDKFVIDSAGTGGWHAGEMPDKRSRAVAAAHGIQLTGRARQFKLKDLKQFDRIIAMDRSNFRDLQAQCDPGDLQKLHLMQDFEEPPRKGGDVPDPYYGGNQGFEEVFRILERSCLNLFQALKEEINNLRTDPTDPKKSQTATKKK